MTSHDAPEAASRRSRRSTRPSTAIRDGQMIIVVDDEDRENEGDLTIAAEKVTPEAINFMAKHGRGLICLPMTEERLDELDIPLMVHAEHGALRHRVLRVDRSQGRDEHRHLGRAIAPRPCWRRSIPTTRPADLARPGHMFPLRARDGGVLVRAGQTEAAVDLARIAGLYPAGVICEIMNDDGTMARVPELTKFAKRHKLLMITIADLIQYRMQTEALVRRVAVGGAADRARRLPGHRVRERHRPRDARRAGARARSATARTSWCACTRAA